MDARRSPIDITRVKITEAGRRALLMTLALRRTVFDRLTLTVITLQVIIVAGLVALFWFQ